MGKNRYIIIGIIISALTILLLVILYFWGIDGGAKLGGAIAGTIGVGAGAFGTYYIVMNFWEQKKINERVEDYRLKSEIDRLTELFYTRIDAFFDLLGKLRTTKNSCVGCSDFTNDVEYLKDKLDVILFKAIKERKNTVSGLDGDYYAKIADDLKLFIKDESLTEIGLCLNRILCIKDSLKNKDSNVNQVWQSIPECYKELAGFYLSWNDSKDENYENALISLFLAKCNEVMENSDIKFLPDQIPSIKLENQSLEFGGDFQFIFTNNNHKHIEIKRIEISNEGKNELTIPLNDCIINNNSEKIILISYPEFKAYIRGVTSNKEGETIVLNLDVYIKYQDSIWKIERIISLTNKETQRKQKQSL